MANTIAGVDEPLVAVSWLVIHSERMDKAFVIAD